MVKLSKVNLVTRKMCFTWVSNLNDSLYPLLSKVMSECFQNNFTLLHDTDILGLACLSASTSNSLEIIEAIQKKCIKLTGKVCGCVFLVCDSQSETFYHDSGQRGNGNHKSHLRRQSKFYIVPLMPFLLFIPPQRKGFCMGVYSAVQG